MPMKRVLSLLPVVMIVGLSHPLSAASPKSNSEAGKTIYLESCQSCHGPTGKGDSDMAAYLNPPPADLSAKKTQAKTDAELKKIILEGRPGMAMSSYEGASKKGSSPP